MKFHFSEGYWRWSDHDNQKAIRGAALFDTLEQAYEHFIHMAGQSFPDHAEEA